MIVEIGDLISITAILRVEIAQEADLLVLIAQNQGQAAQKALLTKSITQRNQKLEVNLNLQVASQTKRMAENQKIDLPPQNLRRNQKTDFFPC
jgi:D-arabinose 5-phosphate isomerase GutQ